METKVNKNTAAIEVCQRDISELKEAATVGQSAKANQIANVQDLKIKNLKTKIKIFRHHVKGLSNETLKMMQLRNKARRNNYEEEYKKLRNECNRKVRKEKFEEAGKLIEEDPNNIGNFFR